MITVAEIETFYSYFYQKKYNDSKNKFRPTKTTKGVCESFLKLCDAAYRLPCVGRTFLWDYFLFQFQYWHDLTLQNAFTDKVAIAFVVGKKAFDRWTVRNREYDWQIDKATIITEYGLDINELLPTLEACEKLQSNPTKEESVPFENSKRIRKEYLNTENGFATCIQLTTLFDPKDLSCIRCNNRSDCKELLRVNYPKLFKQRGLAH